MGAHPKTTHTPCRDEPAIGHPKFFGVQDALAMQTCKAAGLGRQPARQTVSLPATDKVSPIGHKNLHIIPRSVFARVFVKDVGRHCGRCAHLPHKTLEDVNLYFQITKVCSFENRHLRLPGFCVGGVHIFHNVFQHLSQNKSKNATRSYVCGL